MNAREQGFLLLTSHLGLPQRKVLTVPQLRTLAARVRAAEVPAQDREMTAHDLVVLGYSREEGQRIVDLLSDMEPLNWYLSKAAKRHCFALTRVSDGYPQKLRNRLGVDCPGCLWVKGDISLLDRPAAALIGSREILPDNRQFAAEAGYQAAHHGYVLISGNARGADKIAQEACLQAGGSVVCVISDSLQDCPLNERVLYISEDSFDAPFTVQRALSRNRVIHCLSDLVLVAQCGAEKGGTWNGTVQNLRHNWSPVFCYRDGSVAADSLEQGGAVLIDKNSLAQLNRLRELISLRFDQ